MMGCIYLEAKLVVVLIELSMCCGVLSMNTQAPLGLLLFG